MKSFDQLSTELQLVLEERFSRYDLDAEYMFDGSEIFSDQVKSMSDLDILSFMDKKDISHIYPIRDFPELASEPSNIFLEDYAVNRARGAEIVYPEDINIAFQDQIQDTFDLDIDEDGIIDLSGEHLGINEFDWFNWDSFDFSDFI